MSTGVNENGEEGSWSEIRVTRKVYATRVYTTDVYHLP